VIVPTTIEAGTCNVRVMCNVTFPSSSVPHPGLASNPVPFQLIPVIQPAAVPPFKATLGNTLTVTVAPPVGSQQIVVVYIGNQAVMLPKGTLVTPPTTSTTVTVTVPGTFPTGISPLRVEVDGAQSQLVQDANSASPTFGQWLPQVQVS
jgi:hypothetical protein